MQLITFGQPMAPHGVGDTRLVTDDVAKRLGDEGALSACVPWPPTVMAVAPQKPARPVVKPVRPVGSPDRRLASKGQGHSGQLNLEVAE